MKYTCSIVIDLPRQRVVELFDDADSLQKWQPTLENVEYLSGEPGQPQSKSRLTFNENGRKMEMIETVLVRDLPNELTMSFITNGVDNHNINRFTEEGPGKTRWTQETEFKFSGFMRVMAFFMGGAFEKETRKTMEQFKTFAESQG